LFFFGSSSFFSFLLAGFRFTGRAIFLAGCLALYAGLFLPAQRVIRLFVEVGSFLAMLFLFSLSDCRRGGGICTEALRGSPDPFSSSSISLCAPNFHAPDAQTFFFRAPLLARFPQA